MSEHSVHHARWTRLTTDELYGIVVLRNRVFALEQRVTAEDFDGRDREPDTEHWWFGTDTDAVGYLRLIRPAADEVHPAGRGAAGVGDRPGRHRPRSTADRAIAGRLVAAVLDGHGHDPFVLHAQEYVAALYERYGFVRFGEPYDEAGIRHVGMHRARALMDTRARYAAYADRIAGRLAVVRRLGTVARRPASSRSSPRSPSSSGSRNCSSRSRGGWARTRRTRVRCARSDWRPAPPWSRPSPPPRCRPTTRGGSVPSSRCSRRSPSGPRGRSAWSTPVPPRGCARSRTG